MDSSVQIKVTLIGHNNFERKKVCYNTILEVSYHLSYLCRPNNGRYLNFYVTFQYGCIMVVLIQTLFF